MKEPNFQELMDAFLEDNKGEKLTMSHPLNEDSVVLDFGSYTGSWSHKIYDKYKCNVYSYEPIKEFYDQHVKSIGNKKIKVFNYAVDAYDGEIDMFLQKDGTSAHINNNSEKKIKVKTRNVVDIFSEFETIDLVKINIEGAEYDVLDVLYDSGQVVKAKRFMIQFHDIEGYENRLEAVSNKFSETHQKLWGYGTIWQLWERW